MRDAIASTLEAFARCFLWLWMVHHVQRSQIPCADYPFGEAQRFEPGYEFLATVVIAAVVSAPVFAATVLALRRVLGDAAIRAFVAGCVCEAARIGLTLYVDRHRTDLCVNPLWDLWGWAASAFIVGTAAVLAHWLIVGGASVVRGAAARADAKPGADRIA